MFVPRILPVHAIVLRTAAWREKDRLLVLLTKERGKVFALAQGAQMSCNRLAPAAQTGIVATFWLAKAREFDRVTDYKIENFALHLRQDTLVLTAFGIVSELIEISAPLEAPDENLFNEVMWFVDRLDKKVPIVKWLVAAQIRLLWHAGWMPRLISCVLCGRSIEGEHVAFAPSVGGVMCSKCYIAKTPADAQLYPIAVLQAIHSLWQQPRLMEALHLRTPYWEQALSLLRNYWHYHLEADVKAWKVWQQLSSRRFHIRFHAPK